MDKDPMIRRWSDIEADFPMPLIERRRVIGDKMMVSHVTIHKGFSMPTHHHENEQFSAVLSGRMHFSLGAEGSAARRDVEVGAGEVVCIPSNYPHSARALEDSVLLDIFSPPSLTTGLDQKDVRGQR